MKRYLPHTSTLMALPANRLSLACYLSLLLVGMIPVLQYVSWLIPLFLFLSERDSGLLRFHSLQAFLLGITFRVLSGALWVLGIFSTAAAVFVPFLKLPAFLAPISVGFVSGLIFVWGILVIVQLIFAILGMIGSAKWQERPLPLLGRLVNWILPHCSPAKVGPEGSGREFQKNPLDYQGGVPRQVHRPDHGESSRRP